MSEATQTNTSNGQSATASEAEYFIDKAGRRRRRVSGQTRAESKPKRVFVLLQVMDKNGHPVEMSKNQVNIIAIEQNAEKMLEVIDSGEHENAFYIRAEVQPLR